MRRTTLSFVAAATAAGLAFAPALDAGGWTGPSLERLADPLAYLDRAEKNPGPGDLVRSVENIPAWATGDLEDAPIQSENFAPEPVFSFDFDAELVGQRHPSIPQRLKKGETPHPDGGKVRGGNAGDHGTFMEFYTREFEGGTVDVAIQGVNDIGALIWDITDPTEPELLSVINCGYHQSDVGMYELEDGRWIAVIGGDNGSEDCLTSPISPYYEPGRELAAGSGPEVMAFFDVTDLRNPEPLSAIGTSIVATGEAHTIEMQGNAPIAYVVTALDPRLEIVDFSTPEKPVIIGSLDTPGAPHAFRVSDDGSRGYSAGSLGGQTLSVHDLTDPTNPLLIGVSSAPRNLYTHESLPAHSKEFVLVMDEGAFDPGYASGVCPGTGFWLYDLTVEHSPVPLSYTVADIDGQLGTDGTGSGAAACAVHYGNISADDTKLTVAYYGAGVRVFDLSDRLDPEEIGALMFEDSDVWTAKAYKSPNHVFVSDLTRGFEVYEWTGEGSLADREG